jgi:AraC family transcriptional activator of pobA
MITAADAKPTPQLGANVTTTAIDTRVPSFFLYGEAPHKYDERTLHVEPIAFRSAPQRWKINPHVHRTLHQLIFVVRGRGIALAEGGAAQYCSPALVVVPAGTVHGFEFEPGTLGFVASLSDDLLRDVARREPGIAAFFLGPATLELEADALRATDLEQSFVMFAREFHESAAGHELALEGLLEVILANALRLSRSWTESADSALSRRRLLVAGFRELIENEFRRNRSVADYASALNVSESRLRSACVSVTKLSPIQIVHARILLEAKRQLLYTSQTVSEIAYALGFDDPAYFTRFFSQRTGTSPRAFRTCHPHA